MTTIELLDNIIAEQLRPTYTAHVVAVAQARRNEIAKGHQVKKEQASLEKGNCLQCHKGSEGHWSDICECATFYNAVDFPKGFPYPVYLNDKFPTVEAFANHKLTFSEVEYGEAILADLIETMVTKIAKKLKKKNIELETAELTSAWNIDNLTMKINGKHNVKVTVVDAGGYNIQCYHLRQLVHVK